MTPLLQTQSLELAYGRVPACRDISIDVNVASVAVLDNLHAARGNAFVVHIICAEQARRAG